jgi:hypothetical protein
MLASNIEQQAGIDTSLLSDQKVLLLNEYGIVSHYDHDIVLIIIIYQYATIPGLPRCS